MSATLWRGKIHKNVIHTYNEKEIKVLTDGLNVEMKL